MTDIETVDEARSLEAEPYYRHLIRRNKGLVHPHVQQRIREAKVLVAGCGSVGGAAIQPLARIGFKDFRFADSGSYELNNLNRQLAFLDDLGRNKAEVGADAVHRINPHAQVVVFPEGVTAENARALVQDVDVIVDGVDVTTRSGLSAKLALHEAALLQRKPLITGWDLAGVMCAQYFDYRELQRIFDGAIEPSELDSLDIWEAIFRIAPMRHIPTSMLFELASHIADPEYSVPQLPEAAWQFGSLACHMAVRSITGKRIPRNVPVNVHRCTSRLPERMLQSMGKPFGFAKLVQTMGWSRAGESFIPAHSFLRPTSSRKAFGNVGQDSR
ncbi:ThiF family adenylyltransferase [Streptomyces sp. NA04227]|uniref:HesA/MoeB/ThiF family protein n=1 Tax=Streptomyces sp. NA04227 TaxID=2742136 RepID=UPI0015914F47|nr:ThiF family adenylyltransferase [Streptomyces sp. NA04227]QKW09784.1 ThiF family adenylyltransferase [Streptomyces sp. NA04227]